MSAAQILGLPRVGLEVEVRSGVYGTYRATVEDHFDDGSGWVSSDGENYWLDDVANGNESWHRIG